MFCQCAFSNRALGRIFFNHVFLKKKKKKTLVHKFFRERTKKILSISRCNCWEIYKRLNFPDLSGNCSLMNCWKMLHRRCLVRKVFPPPEIQLHFQRFSLLQLKNWLGHILPKILVRSVSTLLLLSQLFFVLSQRLAKVGNILEQYYKHNLFYSISVEFLLKTTLHKKRLFLKLEFLLRTVNLRKLSRVIHKILDRN